MLPGSLYSSWPNVDLDLALSEMSWLALDCVANSFNMDMFCSEISEPCVIINWSEVIVFVPHLKNNIIFLKKKQKILTTFAFLLCRLNFVRLWYYWTCCWWRRVCWRLGLELDWSSILWILCRSIWQFFCFYLEHFGSWKCHQFVIFLWNIWDGFRKLLWIFSIWHHRIPFYPNPRVEILHPYFVDFYHRYLALTMRF